MTIVGTGLGSVKSVYFGSVRSPHVENPPTFMGTSDTKIEAQIPPGRANTAVEIRVNTLAGSTLSAKTFSYVWYLGWASLPVRGVPNNVRLKG